MEPLMAGRLTKFSAGFCCLALAACGKGDPQPNILDAAAVFEANKAVLGSIRAAYPGPYSEFDRMPARDPADDNDMDRAFLSVLREDIPVEFIDFFPIGDTGKDEIDVVLWRYQSGDNWNTVNLIYFSTPMTLSGEHQHMRAFDICDESAVAWLQEKSTEGSASVFCRLDDHWQAFQRVE